MHCDFCGWQREYQPATARVDRLEAKHFREERPISVRVVAVHDEMSTKDHVHMVSDFRWLVWNTPRKTESGAQTTVPEVEPAAVGVPERRHTSARVGRA